jgi:hypothetical protein
MQGRELCFVKSYTNRDSGPKDAMSRSSRQRRRRRRSSSRSSSFIPLGISPARGGCTASFLASASRRTDDVAGAAWCDVLGGRRKLGQNGRTEIWRRRFYFDVYSFFWASFSFGPRGRQRGGILPGPLEAFIEVIWRPGFGHVTPRARKPGERHNLSPVARVRGLVLSSGEIIAILVGRLRQQTQTHMQCLQPHRHCTWTCGPVDMLAMSNNEAKAFTSPECVLSLSLDRISPFAQIGSTRVTRIFHLFIQI